MVACVAGSCGAAGPIEKMSSLMTDTQIDHAAGYRERMVREQLERRGIQDPRVLQAMRKVPRERFVPADLRNRAYDDGALPIGHEQTISQPYIVAFMTEALRLTGKERVLEIGTGSGYQAAVLAELVPEVYSIELVEPLARSAEKTLSELGYRNIKIKIGDGFAGWVEHAPYDAIIVTAAPAEIPPVLVEQLKMGGRMIVPVGVWEQELVLVEKSAKGFITRNLLPVRFVPMVSGKKKE